MIAPDTRARVALYAGAFATAATQYGAPTIEIDIGEHQVLVGVNDGTRSRSAVNVRAQRKIVGYAAIITSPDPVALGRTHAIALCEALGVRP